MLNLGEYIHTGLQRHQELGVPGIGLFKRTRIPARFDKESDSFVPPRFVLTLEPHDADGSALLDKIAEVEHISLEEARESLDLSINRLLADLEERSAVTLEGVGYLQYDEDGTLSLTGIDETYAGLSPVKELLTETPEEVLYQEAEGEEQEPEKPLKKSSSWVWLLSGIILVGLVLAGWWYMDQRRVALNGIAAKNDSVAQVQKADSLAQKQKADSAEAARLVRLKADSLRRDSLTVDSLRRLGKGKLRYEVIVASFPDVPTAEEYVDRMNKQGYHLRVILSKMPGNLKKVSFGSFLREDEAYKALAKVQRTFAKDAWIARIEN